ncbi:MAG: helix-turn-helix domain-containing protein [Actinomycetota bacterium]
MDKRAHEALMTVKDVAAYLKVSQKTVRRMAVDLGASKVGRGLRFRKDLVDRYVESKQLGSSRAPR